MSATTFRRFGQVALLIGLGVFTVGVVGDIAQHTLPPRLTDDFEPLLGVDGYRAHLATLAGMLVVVLGLFVKGVHDVCYARSR